MAKHPQVWQAARAGNVLGLAESELGIALIQLTCRALDLAPQRDLPGLMAVLTMLKDQLRLAQATSAVNQSPLQPLAELQSMPYPVAVTLLWTLCSLQKPSEDRQIDLYSGLAEIADQALATAPALWPQTEACFLSCFR
jgi:hypothetical protein